MRHIAVLAVVFVGPLTAAPVPKAVKAKVPPLAGTVWISKSDDRDLTGWVFTFTADGTLTCHFPKRNKTFDIGLWKLDGGTLVMDMNDHYATVTLTYAGGEFVGSGVNIKGETWKVTLRPKEE